MRLGRVLTVCLLLLLAFPSMAQQAPDPVLRELLRKAANETDSFQDRFDAEVWLHDMSVRLADRISDPSERITILKTVHYEASRADVPPELVLAVIDIESNFDRYAVSHAGARGLMQVMPFWLREIGQPDDNLFHIQTNLRMGCTILGYYMDMENDNLHRALGRYNGSLGSRRYSGKVIAALSNKWYRL
jgi:soluble lytic murein transglycosylase-like protein